MYFPTSVKHLTFSTLVLAGYFKRYSRLVAFLFLLTPYVPSQAANWIQSTEYAGIAYFLYQSPAVIERYDLVNRGFLSNTPLGDIPTAFTLDHDGIYISFGRRTSRFALNGTGEVHLQNTNEDVTDLLVNGDFLYLFHRGGNLLSVNKFTGVLLDWEDYFYSM